ncbi:hypothetical protein [Streptomyces sp. CFMR 7]|uniref:hypothetical protein n=1 Tax=Streptomyces sp. CFMR 7 TaxID=1649184 RepID=UPI0011AA4C3A|nr:hypothetical protein [Streptomyces sp. CFMR 7]
MADLDWEYLSSLADRVAYSIASNWAIVEKDDVKQEILKHAFENRKAIETHYGDQMMLWSIFKKSGTQYASRERDARDVTDGQYYYTPAEVRIALGSFFVSDEELGQMLGRGDDLMGCRVTDNLMSARLDATVALTKLPPKARGLISRYYVEGLPLDNGGTERKAANRALEALARQMNRDTRKANT